MSLAAAKAAAAHQGAGWRVPSVKELYGLIEMNCSEPASNAKVFPDLTDMGEGAPYWTTTAVPDMPPLIYYVDFMFGIADGHSPEFAVAVRLVRDGRSVNDTPTGKTTSRR